MAFRTAAATPSGNYDVNHDGEVTVSDINAIINVIFDGIHVSAADVNNDGEVSIADISRVLNAILGEANEAGELTFTVDKVPFKMIKVDRKSVV